jgi:hypothetical protein
MTIERGNEILAAGLETAKEQLEKRPARPNYPHNFDRLYGWLEDKLFNLFTAIRRKDYRHVRKMSGEIIITASEIAEYSNTRLENPKRPEEKRT